VFALALTWLYDRTDNLLAPINRARAVQCGKSRRAALAKPSRPRMNEFELIAKLTRALPVNESVVTGAGDDCAVLDLGVPDNLILFKTDAVVEDFHFTRERRRKKSDARRSPAA